MILRESGKQITIDKSLTYVNRFRKNCKHPETFEINDLDELLGQPPIKLFARKIDKTIRAMAKHTPDRIPQNNNR